MVPCRAGGSCVLWLDIVECSVGMLALPAASECERPKKECRLRMVCGALPKCFGADPSGDGDTQGSCDCVCLPTAGIRDDERISWFIILPESDLDYAS